MADLVDSPEHERGGGIFHHWRHHTWSSGQQPVGVLIMGLGKWEDGKQIGATDVNTKIVQVPFITKPSNESVTSSTTQQNDNHLFFSATASTNYWIKAYIMVDGADTSA